MQEREKVRKREGAREREGYRERGREMQRGRERQGKMQGVIIKYLPFTLKFRRNSQVASQQPFFRLIKVTFEVFIMNDGHFG